MFCNIDDYKCSFTKNYHRKLILANIINLHKVSKENLLLDMLAHSKGNFLQDIKHGTF